MQARTNFEFRFVISEIFLQIFLLSTYARDKKVQCPTKFKELQFFLHIVAALIIYDEFCKLFYVPAFVNLLLRPL